MISSSTAKRDSLLFVYGTLRSFTRIPLARWLAANARYAGPARTRGRLYDLGAYPGLRPPCARHEWVTGDVYELAAPVRMLRTLDRYEIAPRGRAPRFERVRAAVQMQGNGTRRQRAVWLYICRSSCLRCARIRSGDYRLHAPALRRVALAEDHEIA